MRDVVILGSTGSIGTQALDVIRSRRDRFRVVALTAGGSQLDLLAAQVRRVRPARSWPSPRTPPPPSCAPCWASPHDHRDRGRGRQRDGRRGCRADVVLNAITGAAGLLATLAALEAGTTLALANKESLVIGGRLVTDAAAPGQLVAVDSEHSAFAQALRAGRERARCAA